VKQSRGETILVTGGAGYVGSHVARALSRAGFDALVLDNRGTDPRGEKSDRYRTVLREKGVAAVVHCAETAEPTTTDALLEAMALENVRNLVFTSSYAVYGDLAWLPVTEDHPTAPSSSRGKAMLAAESAIERHAGENGLRFVVLRCFHVAGADPELGSGIEPERLIPRAIAATFPDGPKLQISGADYATGDGTAVRDYVHVTDVAEAHVTAVRHLLAGGDSATLNVGSGKGSSVLEIIRKLELIAGRIAGVSMGARRAGAPAEIVASVEKIAQVLDWRPTRSDLHSILTSELAWSEKHAKQRSQGRGKVAVIGAGPAGLTAAYQLAKAGVAVDVYEAAPQVGGMCRTLELWGQLVDIGPHRFFSTDRRVNALWLEVAGANYRMVDRKTRILYRDSLFEYPIAAMDALQKLGVGEAVHCVASYLRQLVWPVADTSTFEGWVTRAFGQRLYEIFFQSYSEKLWGIPCSELDADFAAQRIKKFSLFAAMLSAVGLARGKQHKTLVDRFAYPDGGTGQIYQEMARRIRELGGNILLRTAVRAVRVEAGEVKGLERDNGEFVAYDEVVSTMPLTAVVRALEEAPEAIRQHAKQLKFRNTILVYLHVDQAGLFPDNWLYIHSPELQTGRITNFANWGEGTRRGHETTILCLEYWCNDDEPLWSMKDEEIASLAKREMLETGLTKGAKILASHVCRVPRSYPVYAAGYKDHLRPIEVYLSTIRGLHAIGRYGAFKYNNQDHSILMGILAAEKILGAAGNHDLWAVNTDYETYQEASTIDETGLVLKSRGAAGSA
jgi:protoporphyrinogen oxidase/UDP-glucose 4-epimerase